MSHSDSPCVATVMIRKGETPIGASRLADIADLLPRAEVPDWLDPQAAADIRFTAAIDELPALRQAISAHLGAAPIDIVLQPLAHRRKALLLADMDSTMIGQECIDELADFAGVKQEVAEITERAMRGEVAFEPALRERVSLLRGLPVTVVEQVLDDRITLMSGGSAMVRTMRANGAYCALVSGGFTLFTGPIAARLGFDEHRSNELEVDGDRLAGRVTEPILGREAKLERLVALRAARGVPPSAVIAVGDGANDLAMLAEAGLGVAFHAKPTVAAAAHARIDHTDLESILFIQGYARWEFID